MSAWLLTFCICIWCGVRPRSLVSPRVLSIFSRAMSSLPADYRPPAYPSVPTRPPAETVAATKEYGLSHTMLRIRDPVASLKFYIEHLGMTLAKISPSEGGKFTNYFLLFPQSAIPEDEAARSAWLWQQQGVVELCHNWGTETDASFAGYKNGNDDASRGFGHICIYVDDLQKSVDRFTSLGIQFKKRPEEGSMRHIAFIYDPDKYWVEVIAKGKN